MLADDDIIDEILRDYKPTRSNSKAEKKQGPKKTIEKIVQESEAIKTLEEILDSGASPKKLRDHITNYVIQTCEYIIKDYSEQILSNVGNIDKQVEIINYANKLYLENYEFNDYERFYDKVNRIEHGMSILHLEKQRAKYISLIKENLIEFNSKPENKGYLIRMIYYVTNRYLDSDSGLSFLKLRTLEDSIYKERSEEIKTQDISVEKYVKKYLSEFELGTRAKNAMNRANITKVKDLLGLSLGDIFAIKDCSTKTVKELYDKVLYPIGARFAEH